MNIFKNKPKFIPTWNLTLDITAGTYVNNVWKPKTDQSAAKFKIYYDYVKLIDSTVSNINGIHKFDLCDDQVKTEHKLITAIDGHLEESDVISCQIFIEGHNLDHVLWTSYCFLSREGGLRQGTTVFVEPGVQILRIHTPIYKWLFNHEKRLL